MVLYLFKCARKMETQAQGYCATHDHVNCLNKETYVKVHLKECYLSNYASEDEITRAIQPLISQYFPVETQTALKFAVLYEARANTGVDRMKIINAVAKSVPAPCKDDLNNPDKNIVVHIVKTMCLTGVVEKYKELAKYNLRQLSSKQ